MQAFSRTRVALFAFTLLLAACGNDDESDDGVGGSGSCAVSSDECVNGCVTAMCGQSISDCSADSMCDAAKDTMVSCVCDAQKADDTDGVGQCLSTFTDMGGFLSTAFTDCATSSCATECGL